MSHVSKAANVIGSKSARACDGCVRKRARWFCAADDAFLCQSCDSRVHSANPVARRHERVRLKTASFRSQPDSENETEAPCPTRSVPSWQSRKARTLRGNQQSSSGFKSPTSDEVVRNLFDRVPEVMSDETTSFNENDGQLPYGRVPIFDSFAAELCLPPQSADVETNNASACFGANEKKGFVGNFYNEVGFVVPSEMDLGEFAPEVESLLGKGLDDDESFGIDGLGLMMEVEGSMMDTTSMRCGGRVKDEDDEEEEKEEEAEEIEMANETFDLSFYYNVEENDEKVEVVLEDCSDEKVLKKKRKFLLRLDYESILSAWDGPSPWASGTRPDVELNECWPTCMATCQIESHQQHLADHAACLSGRMGLSEDGRREARVSRYREKRRTRLFSKKIRYEVRKINAEKRPRMKGRFVKRPLSSFPLTSTVSLLS